MGILGSVLLGACGLVEDAPAAFRGAVELVTLDFERAETSSRHCWRKLSSSASASFIVVSKSDFRRLGRVGAELNYILRESNMDYVHRSDDELKEDLEAEARRCITQMCIGKWSHSTPLRCASVYQAALACGFPADKAEKKAGHAKISKRHHRSFIVSAQSPTPSATVIVLLYEHVNTACLWNLCDSDTP